MANPAYHVKIGLFVVLGFCGALALAIAVGATRAHKKTVAYYTYFNEPVTGLDVGGPIKARGVNVGQVGDIAFAPDFKMIQVRMDMLAGVLDRFGGAQPRLTVNPDLRAQLASQGVTGARFVSIDFFDPTTNPPPVLTFQPPEHYIPAAKSQMKSIEDSVTRAMEGLANLVDTMSREGLSEKTVLAMTSVNDVLTGVHQFVSGLEQQQVPSRTGATIKGLQVAVDKMNGVLDRMDGASGLVATAQRSVGEAGRSTTATAHNLDRVLDEIREAASAVRSLAEQIEREPDSLLKGRTEGMAP